MWFKYLQLCLDLESIDYSIPKRGGRGKTISSTKVEVSKDIYRDWELEKVKKSSFSEWYDDEKQLLFYDGGFRYSKGTQYHPLVRRFNVFILYTNMMNEEWVDPTGGNREKGMGVSELIVEDLQKEEGGQKERYELVERGSWGNPMSVQKRVMKDVVDCENSILAVCQGKFPKQFLFFSVLLPYSISLTLIPFVSLGFFITLYYPCFFPSLNPSYYIYKKKRIFSLEDEL